jgi:hypothetical protein
MPHCLWENRENSPAPSDIQGLSADLLEAARRDVSKAQIHTTAFAEGSQYIEFVVTYDFLRTSELAAWRIVGGDYRIHHFRRPSDDLRRSKQSNLVLDRVEVNHLREILHLV